MNRSCVCLFLVLTLFLLPSCEKEEVYDSTISTDDATQLELSNTTYNYVTLKNVPSVENFIVKSINKTFPLQSRKILSNKIAMRVMGEDGRVTYSVKLSQKDNQNAIYNLVVKESNGEFSRPFIIKYETNSPVDSISKVDFANHDWKISTFWLEDSEYAQRSLLEEEGNEVDLGYSSKDPCNTLEYNSVNNNGGGTGSSGGGADIPEFDESNANSNSNVFNGIDSDENWGGTMIDCQIYIRITTYSCNGPNSSKPHPSGPNSGEEGDNSCGDASSGYSGSGHDVEVEEICEEISYPDEEAPSPEESSYPEGGYEDCPEIEDIGVNNISDDALELINKLPLTELQKNWLLLNQENESLVSIFDYLKKDTLTLENIEFAKWVIDFEMKKQTPPHDYKKSLEAMAQGLKKFGGEEGILLAEFIENMLKDINSMSVGDVKAFHVIMKDAVSQFNAVMMLAIVNAYVEVAKPIIEFALFESGTTLAVKILSKIPVSWVYRGARLNKMVEKVGLLGERGKTTSIRIFKTNAPISNAKETFNMLTKHAISKSTETNGAIVANMGKGNYITYRPITASSSSIPATLSLDFRSAKIWSQVREVKFVRK